MGAAEIVSTVLSSLSLVSESIRSELNRTISLPTSKGKASQDFHTSLNIHLATTMSINLSWDLLGLSALAFMVAKGPY